MCRIRRGYLLLASALTLCELPVWAQAPSGIDGERYRAQRGNLDAALRVYLGQIFGKNNM